jgi:hypothetical protein
MDLEMDFSELYAPLWLWNRCLADDEVDKAVKTLLPLTLVSNAGSAVDLDDEPCYLLTHDECALIEQRVLKTYCPGLGVDEYHHLYQKLALNSRELCSGETGLFLGLAVRLNHSCCPNLIWDGDKTFTALRNIRPIDECCVSYLTAEELFLPTGIRRRLLSRGWGFVCHCSRCEQEGGDMALSLRCPSQDCPGTISIPLKQHRDTLVLRCRLCASRPPEDMLYNVLTSFATFLTLLEETALRSDQGFSFDEVSDFLEKARVLETRVYQCIGLLDSTDWMQALVVAVLATSQLKVLPMTPERCGKLVFHLDFFLRALKARREANLLSPSDYEAFLYECLAEAASGRFNSRQSDTSDFACRAQIIRWYQRSEALYRLTLSSLELEKRIVRLQARAKGIHI